MLGGNTAIGVMEDHAQPGCSAFGSHTLPKVKESDAWQIQRRKIDLTKLFSLFKAE